MRRMRLLFCLVAASGTFGTFLTAMPNSASALEPIPPAPTGRTFQLPDADGSVRQVEVTPSGTKSLSPQRSALSSESKAAATWQYQTELVSPADFEVTDPLVTRVEVNVRTTTRGCIDSESCANKVRKTSGYTWFQALSVEVGKDAEQNLAGLHAGVALGGSGASSQWYFDWSGYWGPASNKNGAELGAPLGHDIKLSENRWYRIRIERGACANGYGWRARIRDLTSSTWLNAGKFCVAGSDRISTAYYFTEIIEFNPCTTDFLNGENSDLSYYDAAGNKYSFPYAYGVYVDNTCSNTNLRKTAFGATIDERQKTRGSNGGLTTTWTQIW